MGGRGAISKELLGLIVVILLLSIFLFPLAKTRLLPSVAHLQHSSACESLGDRNRCFSTPDCDGRPGWRPLTPEKALVSLDPLCDRKGYCCYLDGVKKYYPPGTVLLEVQGTYSGLFRLSKEQIPKLPSENQHEYHGTWIAFESGSEKVLNYLTEGFPKDVKLVIYYYRKEEQNPSGEGENPPYCGATLSIAGRTVPDKQALKRCAPRPTPKTLGFPKLNEPIAPRNIAPNSARIFGPDGGPEDLTITIYYGFQRDRPSKAETYTVPISHSLEETLIRKKK